jgi:SIR2-like domain
VIEWPQHLVDEIARRRVLVFLGSGVSKQSVGNVGKRPPLWIEFLKSGTVACTNRKASIEITRQIKVGELLTACEILKEELGTAWDGLITREFVDPHYSASRLHELIFKLDARLVITQNFDKIYDAYATASSQGTVVVKTYTEDDTASFIRRRQRLILKAHGTIDKPAEMVFTRGDYARARHHHASFYSLLDGLVLTHTCLFLGCGTSDPDIALMLERAVQLHPSTFPHYLVMGGALSVELKRAYKRTLNLEALAYSNANNHEALVVGIESLVQKVESRRLELAASLDW